MTGSEDLSGGDVPQRRGQAAWDEAQRLVRERNDKARETGREERRVAEQRLAAFERDERSRGVQR